MKVVCDSTVLIGLAKIRKIELLHLICREVFIPDAVFNEVVTRGKGRPGVKEIATAGWVKRERPAYC